MKLLYVTLTGADNTVKPAKLVELSEKYPYVEWAILFSKSKSCAPRYPSLDWVFELGNAADGKNVNLAAHLCGQWVSEAMCGKSEFLENKFKLAKLFGRVQLNMGKDRLAEAMNCKPLLGLVKKAINEHGKHIIFGGNYKYITVDADFFLSSGFGPLFDASGGRGVETKDWPKPFTTAIAHGYAGGLGPDNVAVQLPRIAEAAGDTIVWIDMETYIRRDDGKNFDLEKCERVLQIAQSWIEKNN